MLTVDQKLKALTNLGGQLNQVADLDILMERILTEARRFVNADAGSIYIRDHDELRFSYTQNATQEKRLPKGEKLIYSTFTIPIDDNSIAGYTAGTARNLNIADVYEIGEGVPYCFSRRFDETSGYRTRSMLTIPLVTNRDDVVGVLQIINAQNDAGRVVAFSADDEKMMDHFASVATMALERARMTRAIILRMISMAEMRDPKETGPHVNRVAAYSVEIYENWAKKKGTPQEEIDAKRDVLRMAAMLHDVGKVAISDAILKKPGRFTDEEFEIMKEHSRFGAHLFMDKQSELDDAAAEVALNHHEKWNGKGYPGYIDVATGLPLEGHAGSDGKARGKSGLEIPLLGRVVAIADVFDALCSQRVYKPAWKESDALNIIKEEKGNQFDPELVEAFFSSLDIIRSIAKRYPDENKDESKG
ncbi:MAG: HD domain-containing protein [Thermodesulfobacteriota bacterium]|nr:HD domain-containing protein [Thermodesulfobacteriota bacterium]